MIEPSEYIGQEYPDCFEFCRAYFRDHGVDVPPLSYTDRDLFEHVTAPLDGDLALLRRYGHYSHAGIYHSGGILHYVEGAGVIYQPTESFDDVRLYRPKR